MTVGTLLMSVGGAAFVAAGLLVVRDRGALGKAARGLGLLGALFVVAGLLVRGAISPTPGPVTNADEAAIQRQVLSWKACPASKDDVQTAAGALLGGNGDRVLGSQVGTVTARSATVSLLYEEDLQTQAMTFALDRKTGQVTGTDPLSKQIVGLLHQEC